MAFVLPDGLLFGANHTMSAFYVANSCLDPDKALVPGA
jgi:hypothetical protein